MRDLATPVLVVGTRYDAATGYQNSTAIAQQLGDQGVLLTYDGWGHVAYSLSPCVIEATDQYLIARILPAPDTHCPAAA